MRLAWRNWRPWHLDVVGTVLAVGVTVAAYFLGIRPLVESRSRLTERGRQLEVLERQATALEKVLAGRRRRLETVDRALASDSLRLRPVSDLNRRLAEVSALATDCGFQIADCQTGTVAAGAHYGALPITLDGRGTYRTCTQFLNRLREAFPDTSVSTLDLTATHGDPCGTGAFRVGLRWYAMPGGQAAGP
jgi:Tfp pilus assembly protein PilO